MFDKFDKSGGKSWFGNSGISRLETRSARAGLKGLTFKNIGPGLAVGYRKGARGGKWVARVYSGDRSYRLEVIGWADDAVEADGVQVLTFWQAVAKAQALTTPVATGPFTVARAVEDYLRHLEGRRSYRDTQLRLNAYVLPIFGMPWKSPISNMTIL